MTRWQTGALCFIAGSLAATVACLAAIAHETITHDRRTR